mmetsp:Transcript_33943/g.88917  ORF Transcript_33943/g.88917 Transcript_33943/m.88917 type:complete len:256 (+) Transcript_33943:441-1208(+)
MDRGPRYRRQGRQGRRARRGERPRGHRRGHRRGLGQGRWPRRGHQQVGDQVHDPGRLHDQGRDHDPGRVHDPGQVHDADARQEGELSGQGAGQRGRGGARRRRRRRGRGHGRPRAVQRPGRGLQKIEVLHGRRPRVLREERVLRHVPGVLHGRNGRGERRGGVPDPLVVLHLGPPAPHDDAKAAAGARLSGARPVQEAVENAGGLAAENGAVPAVGGRRQEGRGQVAVLRRQQGQRRRAGPRPEPDLGVRRPVSL